MRGQFVFRQGHGKFRDGLTAMFDVERILNGVADWNVDPPGALAVDGYGHLDLAAGRVVVDAELDCAAFSHNAVARRPLQHDAPVPLIPLAGQNGVDRSVIAAVGEVFRYIVNLSVGQQNGAGEPIGRDIGKRCEQAGKQARFAVRARCRWVRW